MVKRLLGYMRAHLRTGSLSKKQLAHMAFLNLFSLNHLLPVANLQDSGNFGSTVVSRFVAQKSSLEIHELLIVHLRLILLICWFDDTNWCMSLQLNLCFGVVKLHRWLISSSCCCFVNSKYLLSIASCWAATKKNHQVWGCFPLETSFWFVRIWTC